MDQVGKDLISTTVESEGDKIHRISRSLLSTIPVLGGTAVEAFNSIISPPIEKRREKWMMQVQEVIEHLLEKKTTVEDLINNEQFISVLIEASSIAIRNHDVEKLKFLKNAVFHSGSAEEPDQSESSQLNLYFISRLTTNHLKVLSFLHDPVLYEAQRNLDFSEGAKRNLSELVEEAFPEFKLELPFIMNDLYAMSLIASPDFLGAYERGKQGVKIEPRIFHSQTTGVGERLIKFIRDY